ncbi:MAG: DNA gyrase inhibitor YacG [Deltaproteobacteria bacterium]|nr:DNA gyrase inhibitor YacG [Deltaproteobacteria bacterium]
MERVPTCPICRKPAAPRPGNLSAPFCSERCRRIDLGKWLGEEYRLSVPAEEAEAARPPSEPDEDRADG